MGFTSYNEFALNETYDSYVELKKLTEDVYMARGSNKQTYPWEVYSLADLSKQSYKILPREFLLRTGISFGGLGEGGVSKGRFFPTNQYYELKKEYLGRNGLDAKIQKYRVGVIVIWSPDRSTIIHEIEHAWDSYRSKGKFNNNAGNAEWHKREKEGPLTLGDTMTLYARTAHEMSAFFVAAVRDVNFFYGYASETDMKPFSAAYDDFKRAYNGYEYLGDKEKKILARKFSQYYYRIRERKPGDE